MSESKLEVSDMIKASIASLAEVKGSTMAAVEKYVKANYPEDEVDMRRLRRTFSTGVTAGWLVKEGEKFKLVEVAMTASKASSSAKAKNKGKPSVDSDETKTAGEEAMESAADPAAELEGDVDGAPESASAAELEDKPMPSAEDEESASAGTGADEVEEGDPKPTSTAEDGDAEAAEPDASVSEEPEADADADVDADASADADAGAEAGASKDEQAQVADAEEPLAEMSKPSLEDDIKVAVTELCKKVDVKATLETVLKHLEGKSFEEEAVKECMDAGVKSGWLVDGGEEGFHLLNPVQTPEKASA